jgi:TolA-binding protein
MSIIFKWSIEAALAAAAMVITAAGSVYTTVYHSGQTNQQLSQMKDKVDDIEKHVDRHDDQLAVIRQQNAVEQRSLDDIKETVHDIQYNQAKK